ncbi:MFS general substrate transporter [Apiospora kogelbergensis]|uniref:MFS general substrate transporter n=1 Tax=Apiospora kogelbergensis TaxID=1337665 RepID=A0AAW0QXW9_9PEZI
MNRFCLSYRILVSLIVGLAALVGFFWLEGSTWVPEPAITSLIMSAGRFDFSQIGPQQWYI